MKDFFAYLIGCGILNVSFKSHDGITGIIEFVADEYKFQIEVNKDMTIPEFTDTINNSYRELRKNSARYFRERAELIDKHLDKNLL